MVPLKLQIKNFVSYGPKTQVIDFTPYNLICLSGKNGYGKSALLDAITWAVWGQARRVAGNLKSDESLMHMGQTSMMVTLDFLAKDQSYRVRREYSLASGKKNYSNLEFAIIDEKLNIYRPLTDKTIKSTQEKIDKIIGLDYNSFINSAFFKQNQSNEFSKKSAKERKEILANILGLNNFEEIKKLASEKAKNFCLKKDYHSQISAQIEKDIENKSEIKDKLKKVIEDIELLTSKENSYKNLLKEVKKEKENILDIKSKVQKIILEKEQLNLLVKNNKQLIIEDYKKWQQTSRNSEKIKDIETIDITYNKFLNELNLVQNINRKIINIKDNLYSKNKDLENYILNVKDRFKLILEDKNIKNYKSKINLDNLKNRLTETENIYIKYINDLKVFKENLKIYDLENFISLENKFEKRKEFYNKFKSKINYIENEIKEIDQKSIFIEKENQALCPLCNQNLEHEYKNNLNNRLKEEKKFLNYRLNKLININNNLNNILIDQANKIKIINKKTQEANILKIKIEDHIEKVNNLDLEIKKYKELILKEDNNFKNIEKEISSILSQEKEVLEKDENINLLKKQIFSLDSELNILLTELKNYKKEDVLIEKIKELQNIKKDQANFLLEFSNLKERFNKISKLIKETKNLKKELKEKDLEYNNLKYIFEKELVFQEQEKTLEDSLNKILIEKQELMLLKGSIQEQDKILNQKEIDYKENKKILNYLAEEIEDYKAISMALSKDGIQALLIEEIIPEIENEANNLLALLTDNQAHIIIESLKDLKSGGTKETLDIKISDSLGIRPYELFSGGEAFKIDFALRIAISKLLSKRAGASLQTLIIDEGFGSQDEEGLSNVMNILYKIQDSFSKVIIVSHLTSMKDQFPVNFIVHKTPQGTLIKVLEQG